MKIKIERMLMSNKYYVALWALKLNIKYLMLSAFSSIKLYLNFSWKIIRDN